MPPSFFSRLLLLLALACPLLPAAAQPAAPEAPTTRYWVFFTDKGEAGEAVPISAAARLRRQRRGQAQQPDLDRPVASAYRAALAALGGETHVESRWLNAVSATLTPAQRTAAAQLPFVQDVRPVARLTATRAPEGLPRPVPFLNAAVQRTSQLDYGPSRRQLAAINAIAPLERGINGRGVRLGFLDTEYGNFTHPVFARLVAEGRLLAQRNFTQGPQSNRHGLNVASIAVGFAEGQLIGPAWGASVLAATTEYAPTETNREEDDFVAGLEWLEAQGADVVNSSLGYTTFDAGQRSYTPADLNGNTGVTTRAVDRAVALGVVVVVSAGNDGNCLGPNSPPGCWYYIGTPADADSVIAVGAVRIDSSRSSFSSRGPTADGRIKPDVSAPGENIVIASGNGYSSFGAGTSFASPLVAGVACQILQANPNLTPIEVRDLLRRTASRAGKPDNELGWGIINADAAIRQAAAALPVEVPAAYRFTAPYPNPTAGAAVFEVASPAPLGRVRLALYDLLGRRVAVVFDGDVGAGVTPLVVDGNELSAGVYLYVLEGEAVHESGRLVILR